MTHQPIVVKTEIKESDLIDTFNSLTKAHRIRLISELADHLAFDLSKVEKPTPESSEEPMSETEELIMALFAISNLGTPVRRRLLARAAAKQAAQA